MWSIYLRSWKLHIPPIVRYLVYAALLSFPSPEFL
jgi:hypothetical protein